MKIAPIDKSKLAKNGEGYRALVESDADWIVRSKDDLYELRANEKDGVFAKLPEPDFQAFVGSLEFQGGGVSTGYYKSLMSSLTLTEIHQVFAHFGIGQEYLNSDMLETGACSRPFVAPAKCQTRRPRLAEWRSPRRPIWRGGRDNVTISA